MFVGVAASSLCIATRRGCLRVLFVPVRALFAGIEGGLLTLGHHITAVNTVVLLTAWLVEANLCCGVLGSSPHVLGFSI